MIRVVLLQDWTKSLVQLRRALKRIVPGMFTRFHDAMLLASRDQAPRGNARHAIIVLTDGIDSGRGSSFDVRLARRITVSNDGLRHQQYPDRASEKRRTAVRVDERL